jgi:hypothetical protein
MARHPNKEIEAALKYAKGKGWSIIKSLKGHCWGMIRCSHGRGGCQKSVWSTPKSLQSHAKAIRNRSAEKERMYTVFSAELWHVIIN